MPVDSVPFSLQGSGLVRSLLSLTNRSSKQLSTFLKTSYGSRYHVLCSSNKEKKKKSEYFLGAFSSVGS